MPRARNLRRAPTSKHPAVKRGKRLGSMGWKRGYVHKEMYADTSVQTLVLQNGGEKKTQQAWRELVETMWNSQEGKTPWMSSVLKAHKVSSVPSNLVPMVTNTHNSGSNTTIMSKQVNCVGCTNTARWNCNNLYKCYKNCYWQSSHSRCSQCRQCQPTLAQMMQRSVWSEFQTWSTVTQSLLPRFILGKRTAEESYVCHRRLKMKHEHGTSELGYRPNIVQKKYVLKHAQLWLDGVVTVEIHSLWF